MPHYKLTYFNIMGLAEPIRFLLHYGGIKFEDIRLERESWPKIKPSMPFGQVPVLEIDGKTYSQTLAICRYLAKQLDLIGKTDLDALQIDALANAIFDFRKIVATFFRESDPVLKAKKKEETMRDSVPFYLNKFEELIKANGGYFYNGQVSYADIIFVALIDHINYICEFDITKDHPNLKALQEKILSVPGIKAWVESRPKLDF